MTELDIEELQSIDEARRTRFLLENQLERRTNQLINGLVKAYRDDKFNPDKALGAIAEISGMKIQIDQCTRTMRGAE